MAVDVVVEQLLPLADHAEALVVHHQHFDRQLRGNQGRELRGTHLKAAIADHSPDWPTWLRRFDTHGSWQRVPHGAKAAAGEDLARSLETVMQGHEHLVLTDIGHNGG